VRPLYSKLPCSLPPRKDSIMHCWIITCWITRSVVS